MLFRLAFLVLCVPVILVFATGGSPWQYAEEIIKDVQSYEKFTRDQLCDKYTCCTVASDESCSISVMPRDQTTLVLPGGETRCIFSTSTPFAFQVIPGDSDKLLFYFQGGGACWDQYSTELQLCTTDVSPQSPVGVFDRNNLNNALRSYTVVHVMYCSGDVHGGNVQQPYNDKAGQPVVQKGLANGQSALDWVSAQVQNGGLAKTFSELVVMGCSAGSIGAQLWAKQVLSTLSWKQAAVVPDSYAGDFPPNTMGPLIFSYNFCSSGFLSEENYQKCMNKALTLQDINMEFQAATPNIPYSFIQSKTDAVQISFYDSVGISMNSSSKSVSPTQFYQDVNTIFGGYNVANKNFVTYLVDGDHHCFTNQDLYYTADGSGPSGSTSYSGLKMFQWVNQLPLNSGSSIDTSCVGELVSGTGSDNTYCSTAVSPKTFVEQW